MAVDGGGRHAIGDVGRRNFARHNVVEQDVAECSLSFWGVQSGEVNACVGKGLVGWSKDGERTGALQRLKEFGLDDTSHQRIVDAGALCGSWDVIGGIAWHQHLVDDMDETVTGHHVSDGHVGVIDHDASVDGERKRLTIGGVRGQAVRDIRSGDFRRDHVVQENVGERLLALGSVKVSEINACVGEGLVGWSEHGERPGALERGQQVGLNHGSHQ